MKEVGEQVALAETGACCSCLTESAVASNHRSFIHDEDRAFSGIGCDAGGGPAVGSGLAEVNAAVDGARLKARVSAHDLRGAARRGEQFYRTAQVAEDLNEGGHGRCFSSSGIAPYHQAATRLRADQEAAQCVDESVLTGGWGMWKCPPEAVFNFVG